jgi:hypothetical protein
VPNAVFFVSAQACHEGGKPWPMKKPRPLPMCDPMCPNQLIISWMQTSSLVKGDKLSRSFALTDQQIEEVLTKQMNDVSDLIQG